MMADDCWPSIPRSYGIYYPQPPNATPLPTLCSPPCIMVSDGTQLSHSFRQLKFAANLPLWKRLVCNFFSFVTSLPGKLNNFDMLFSSCTWNMMNQIQRIICVCVQEGRKEVGVKGSFIYRRECIGSLASLIFSHTCFKLKLFCNIVHIVLNNIITRMICMFYTLYNKTMSSLKLDRYIQLETN